MNVLNGCSAFLLQIHASGHYFQYFYRPRKLGSPVLIVRLVYIIVNFLAINVAFDAFGPKTRCLRTLYLGKCVVGPFF